MLGLVTGSVNAFCNRQKMGERDNSPKKRKEKDLTPPHTPPPPNQLMLKVFVKIGLLVQVQLAAKFQFCQKTLLFWVRVDRNELGSQATIFTDTICCRRVFLMQIY